MEPPTSTPFKRFKENYLKAQEEDISLKTREWVILEKIHGVDVTFYIGNHFEDEPIKVARRNDFIDPGECFYNHAKIQGSPRPHLLKLRSIIESRAKTGDMIKSVAVCGELYGRFFPAMNTGIPIFRQLFHFSIDPTLLRCLHVLKLSKEL